MQNSKERKIQRSEKSEGAQISKERRKLQTNGNCEGTRGLDNFRVLKERLKLD